MQISPITVQNSNQNFKAKPFRLKVKDYTKSDSANLPYICIKEYLNPNAEALYKQAANAKGFYEKLALYNKMGEYKLIPIKA